MPLYSSDLTSISPLAVVAIAIACVPVIWSFTRNRHSAKLPYPPGPPAKPLLGNILEVSPRGAWTKFTELKSVYGNLVFFHGLGNYILVLNSLEAIQDLLDKRGPNYSHRPVFTVVGELMGLGQSMPLLPYGNEWRIHRKLAHVALNAPAVKKYYNQQEYLAAVLCKELIDEPLDFFKHVRMVAGRIIMSVTYGFSIDTADAEYIDHAEATMHVIGKATVPGAFIADLIPILKYLPSWVPFQKEAKAGREMIEKLVTEPYEHVLRDMANGTAAPSIISDILSGDSKDTPDLEHHLQWTAGAMYGAGGETTYATILTFMMAMALYPETQTKAQAEIQGLIGTGRLPDMSDRSSLPYVNALIKETMRWHPSLPLSIARCTDKDDTYNGYFIPKGTIVIPNVWAIAFDKDDRYDPREFIPERFMDSASSPIDPAIWAFGFGRRICPGKALAENSLFILVATILATLNISLPPDGQLKPRFGENLVSYPEAFLCTIVPRFPGTYEMIQARAAH